MVPAGSCTTAVSTTRRSRDEGAEKVHTELHWFYWESYSTGLSGFALFTVLYLWNASTFLIDKTVYDGSPAGAVAAALGFLVVFWLAYDLICRTLGQRKHGDLIVGVGVSIAVVVASWLACHFFAGRAAFLLVGAMVATAMSANVYFWIIPGQRTVIKTMSEGLPVDPIHGQRAKQRSVHNTYFTLPVLVAMMSNHYGWLYQGRWNWLVLVLLMLAGALIRHLFVARHKAHVKGVQPPWGYAIAGTVLILALVVWLAPKPAPAVAASAPPVTMAQVKAVIDQRCAMCHNAQLQQKNVALHTPELIKQHALTVYQQAAVLKLMPMNNATQITDEERALSNAGTKRAHPPTDDPAAMTAGRTIPQRGDKPCSMCRSITPWTRSCRLHASQRWVCSMCW